MMPSSAQHPADPGRLGRRERNKHTTRSELLAAARRLFAERGLNDATIEDLTAAAGVAKGTIYGYFRSKEDLALAVVRLGFLELEILVRARLGRGGSPRERIARIVSAHAEFFSRNPDLMRVFHQVRGVLKFNRTEWRPLRGALANHIGVLAELLLDGRAGAGSRALALRQARAVFGALSGIMSVHASLYPGSRRPMLPRDAVRGIVLLALSLAIRQASRLVAAPARESDR